MADPRDYSHADISRLRDEIAAALPSARFEQWRDFGFALDVYVGSRGCTACQPESDIERGIFRTAEEVERLLTLQ